MLRSDRIEHTLERYKYAFICNFQDNINNFCELHNNESNRKIKSILTEIKVSRIINFFDCLKKSYLNWINAEIRPSIDILKKLLEDYEILNNGNIIQSNVLFRGRKSGEFISHWDMFHIPYNKRYLIQNQRYSLNGQPILYLSLSPYTVIRELGTTEDVRISTFRLVENSLFNVYENINKFNDIVVEGNEQELTPKDSTELIIYNNIIDDHDKVVSNFFQMILASCCSFERREDTRRSSFSEEYVLPQILTLVLKQHNYDGVKYISTKAYTDSDIINSPNITNVLYSNICLFTNYTEEESKEVRNVYDRELYNKFVLSNPHKYNECISEEFFSIEETLRLLDTMLSDKNISVYENEVLVNIGNVLMDLQDFVSELCENDECRVKELYKSINLHSFFLRNIILNINENKYRKVEGGFTLE